MDGVWVPRTWEGTPSLTLNVQHIAGLTQLFVVAYDSAAKRTACGLGVDVVTPPGLKGDLRAQTTKSKFLVAHRLSQVGRIFNYTLLLHSVLSHTNGRLARRCVFILGNGRLRVQAAFQGSGGSARSRSRPCHLEPPGSSIA